MVGARVTIAEKATIQLAAEAAGFTVSEWIHRLVVPEARKRLVHELSAQELIS